MADHPIRFLSPTQHADIAASSGGSLAAVVNPVENSEGSDGILRRDLAAELNALTAADHALTAPAVDHSSAEPADNDLFPSELTTALAETLARRHVVILRDTGWRLPLAPVLEFLAAIVIELILAAMILMLGLHGGLAGHGGRSHMNHGGASAAIGGVVAEASAPKSPKVPHSWHLPRRLPPPPSLPADIHTPVAWVVPHPKSFHNPIIGIPHQQDAWVAPTPDLAPRVVPHVGGTGRGRSRGPQPTAVRQLGRSRNYNPNAGLGPPVPLLKGQQGGQSGVGLGRGRGLSDADGGVKVLSWGREHVPIKYQIDPAYMSGTYRAWISASGRVTKVKVVKSCGHPSMDQSFIDVVEHTRFAPAISDGVPISSAINITLSYGSPD